MYIYYVYAYLREDLTPYYIGKGKNNRTVSKHTVAPPINGKLIQFIAIKLNEHEAFLLEIKLIKQFGRKDLGTGILRNMTNGGDGASGRKHSAESKLKQSLATRGRPSPHNGKIYKIVTCTKCGKLGAGPAMSRYHFANCGKQHNPAKIIKCALCNKRKHVGARGIIHSPLKGRPNLGTSKSAKATHLIKLTCPHCNKIGDIPGMKRYHFNNCKLFKVILP